MRRVPVFVGAWSNLIVICVLVALLLNGCTAPARPNYTASEAGRAQIIGFENIRAHPDDPRPSKSEYDSWRPVTDKDKPAMLAISGGGAGGAFSVGVLSAWSELGNRPSFEVVTGVSTGALIAPFAFLGPNYDQRLRGLYLSDQARNLVDINWRGLGVSPRAFFSATLSATWWRKTLRGKS
jgi:predicted acylesterase/phospholipase RssA